MTFMKRHARLFAIAATAVLISASPMAATARTQAPSSAGAQTFAYAFQDADVTQVVQEILGNGLGLSYRVDPRVTGRITFRIDQRLTREQLLAALESTLSQYNIVIVHDGGTLVVRPRDDAQSGLAVSGAMPAARAGYQVRAIPVRYGSATEIAKALETLSHEKLVFFSSDSLGLIVLGGTSEELESAARSIEVFDQNSLSDARIRFYPLSHSDATTVAGELGQILGQSGMSGIHIAPMKRLNGVFAFARTPEVLDRVGEFVHRLDVPSVDPTLQVAVYQPRGGTAESLARTLNQVLGLTSAQDTSTSLSLDTPRATATGSPPQGQSADARRPAATDTSAATETADAPEARGGGDARVIADRDANVVIISGPEALRVRALAILNDIDREPTQVFLEASIIEVTLNDEFSFGVDWSALKGAGAISNFTSDVTNFPTAAPGLTVSYLKSDIRAAITALSSHSRVLVLSAPKITTRENVQATLKIGDEVPIITQTAESTTVDNAPIINSVSYKDTGVMLQVTPHVLAGNRVALDIVQEVSSAENTVTSGIDSPTIHERNLQSSLILPEDTVVALGGLISSSRQADDTGAPGLSSVPFLGNLFKSQNKTNARTELIVLLKARILRHDDAFNQVLANLNADMKELSATGMVNVP